MAFTWILLQSVFITKNLQFWDVWCTMTMKLVSNVKPTTTSIFRLILVFRFRLWISVWVITEQEMFVWNVKNPIIWLKPRPTVRSSTVLSKPLPKLSPKSKTVRKKISKCKLTGKAKPVTNVTQAPVSPLTEPFVFPTSKIANPWSLLLEMISSTLVCNVLPDSPPILIKPIVCPMTWQTVSKWLRPEMPVWNVMIFTTRPLPENVWNSLIRATVWSPWPLRISVQNADLCTG